MSEKQKLNNLIQYVNSEIDRIKPILTWVSVPPTLTQADLMARMSVLKEMRRLIGK